MKLKIGKRSRTAIYNRARRELNRPRSVSTRHVDASTEDGEAEEAKSTAHESNQSEGNTWMLHGPRRRSDSWGLRSRRVRAGFAHPDEKIQHPESQIRGLPRRQPAGKKYSWGLRSRRAGFAHLDEKIQHPESRTRGLPRR